MYGYNTPNAVYAEQMKNSYSYPEPAQDCAVMEPYTTQISNRLGEADKYLNELIIQLSRIADKLTGPVPTEANPSTKELNKPAGMMEQIVQQTNVLNRRIHGLGEVVNRLQSL